MREVVDSVAEFQEVSLADVVHELRQLRAAVTSQQAELLTGKQAAKFLGISVASLYRLAASTPALRAVTVGQGAKRWRRADLQKYVSELRK